METNELLSLDTFPKSYETCFLESCSVKRELTISFIFRLPFEG